MASSREEFDRKAKANEIAYLERQIRNSTGDKKAELEKALKECKERKDDDYMDARLDDACSKMDQIARKDRPSEMSSQAQNILYQTDYDTFHKARSSSVNPLGAHERENRDMRKRDLGAVPTEAR